jgi:hypothetical protein
MIQPALSPRLSYSVDHRAGWSYTLGDVPLYTVWEVSASGGAGQPLRAYVRGVYMKRDGSRGKHERSTRVDLSVDQPQWLAEIIADARRRLS